MNVAHMPSVNRLLRQEYRKRRAPVRDLMRVQTRDPFRVLVSALLSARTRDEMTSEVVRRLFRSVRRPADLRRIPLPRLRRLVFPIGFYRTKAKHLKQLARVLEKRFGNRIPDTVEELCELPGVGRKTANLVVAVAFDKPAICVDVHVHRITNRLGLVHTRTPLETEMALRRILPVRYWKTLNPLLVSFGQTVCLPVRPKCDGCPLRRFCSRAGVA
jgi:endonuclease III